MRRRSIRFLSFAVGAATINGGCVERMMTLESDPPGALVYMNDQEIGRTPVTRDFEWYGNYDVAVRKEGYQTLKTETDVKAPWWQWVPIDLFAEILPIPFKDHQRFTYTLVPASTQPADERVMYDRAVELRDKLEGSQFVPPTTHPTPTSPATFDSD